MGIARLPCGGARDEIAAEKRCTAAQLALVWLLDRGPDIVPIAGTKRRKYLEDNLGALAVTLTDEDRARIDAAAPKGVTAGARYAPQALARVHL